MQTAASILILLLAGCTAQQQHQMQNDVFHIGATEHHGVVTLSGNVEEPRDRANRPDDGAPRPRRDGHRRQADGSLRAGY